MPSSVMSSWAVMPVKAPPRYSPWWVVRVRGGWVRWAGLGLLLCLAGLAAEPASHWAFQPVRTPSVPEVRQVDQVQNPVDAFVLARLEAKSLGLSPRADRRVLIRRVTYDLTGLPPTPEEVAAFEADESADAFARVVDRLLASPRYGERWGRHWLDVARYADTKGYLAGGEQRRFAFSYTYRDYVIRAFNEDLPFDRFLLEQLAADRLELGEDRRPLAALGFLTLGRRFLNNPHDIIDDRIDVVARGLMGLTVSCARCHDHKFDPIPIEDYYSLYGVFANSREPEEKPLLGIEPLPEALAAYRAEKQRRQDELDRFRREKVEEGLAELRRRAGEYLLAAQEAQALGAPREVEELAQQRKLVPGVVRRWMESLERWRRAGDPVWAPWFLIVDTAEAERPARSAALAQQWMTEPPAAEQANPVVAGRLVAAPPQSLAALAEVYGQLMQEWEARRAAVEDPELRAAWQAIGEVLSGPEAPVNLPADQTDQLLGAAQPRIRELQAQVDEVDATHDGAPPRAMALEDAGTRRAPRVFLRGNPGNPGPEVPIQFLGFLAGADRQPFTQGSGRLELARAVVSADNPLTARVWVNRVWMHHFGRPLVGTPSDFGTRAEPPTHPLLLDYLAASFMENGWSVKRLHRLILLSRTYQQSSAQRPEADRIDPENQLLWRMNRRRLDFEATRDTLLAVAGNLTAFPGGRSVEMTTEPYATCRTVYGFIERQNLPGLFRTFDFASPDSTCPRRFTTTVPQQALYLMNSPFVMAQGRVLARRPELAGADSVEGKLSRLFQIAYQRDPSPEELTLAVSFLAAPPSLGDTGAMADRWQYGYGAFEEGTGHVSGFELLPHFTGTAWQGGSKLPDPSLSWVSLSAQGGHPGNRPGLAAIRRWAAPRRGTITVSGTIHHSSDQGDGVRGRVVSSRLGLLGEWMAQHGQVESQVDRVAVEAGDYIDFVTDCRAHEGFDSFQWAPVIRYLEGESGAGEWMNERLRWDAQADFRGPPSQEPLDAWEQLAQVVLVSNELFFVD